MRYSKLTRVQIEDQISSTKCRLQRARARYYRLEWSTPAWDKAALRKVERLETKINALYLALQKNHTN